MCLKSDQKSKNQNPSFQKFDFSNNSFLKILLKALIQGFKLSKDQNNESNMINESIGSNLLDIMMVLKFIIKKNENNIYLIDIINFSVGILKNNAGDQNFRSKLLEKCNIETVCYYFHFFHDVDFSNKNQEEEKKEKTLDEIRNSKILSIYINITCLFRNLAVQSECIQKYLETEVNIIL